MSVRAGDRQEGKITAIDASRLLVANAERGDTYYQVKRMKAHFERVISDGNGTRTDAQSGT